MSHNVTATLLVDLAVDEQEYVRSDLLCELTYGVSRVASAYMPLHHAPHAIQFCLIALDRSRDILNALGLMDHEDKIGNPDGACN